MTCLDIHSNIKLNGASFAGPADDFIGSVGDTLDIGCNPLETEPLCFTNNFLHTMFYSSL